MMDGMKINKDDENALKSPRFRESIDDEEEEK